MTRRCVDSVVIILFSLAMTGCATSEEASILGDLAAMMEGDFISTTSGDESQFIDRRRRLVALGDGEWIYWQVNTGTDRKLYRQRVLQLTTDSTGRIEQTTFSLAAKKDHRDLIADADRLASITVGDLTTSLNNGCQLFWTRSQDTEEILWRGIVSPDQCVISSKRRGQDIRIGAESVLSGRELWQAERGFDLAGQLLWGTPPGEFNRLTRVPE
ncbi:MAG: chromophore lyase CpcT/CpeT [Woeseiaceae bacterium]